MNPEQLKDLPEFLSLLEFNEMPMGIHYADQPPLEGYHPPQGDLPTAAAEKSNRINWGKVFGDFSCTLKNIYLARKKKTAAWLSADHFGCPGAAFWCGFLKPQTETIIKYVSTGIPGRLKGEHYCESSEILSRTFFMIDPVPAPKPYLVVKPLDQFSDSEHPDLVSFFGRVEQMAGLHQLAFFVTNETDVVASPWSAACGSLAAWPYKYLMQGTPRAVVGGWDPSARKFFKPDELSFTVPFALFSKMLSRHDESFLSTDTWGLVKKKARRSENVWNKRG